MYRMNADMIQSVMPKMAENHNGSSDENWLCTAITMLPRMQTLVVCLKCWNAIEYCLHPWKAYEEEVKLTN